MYKVLPTILAITLNFIFISQAPGYNYGKQIIINSSKVSGTSNLSNFPVLISFTDPDLRSNANGGRIQNENGYDITFTSDDCVTELDYEIESYNAANGTYNIWVKIPSLLATSDYALYMYYGNNTITSNPSSANTWSHGYDGVWHLHNDLLDASASGNNGSNFGSTNTSPSKIANGQNFARPNHYISINNHPSRTGSFSYSGWAKTINRSSHGQRIICDDENNSNGSHALSVGDPGTGRIRFYIRGMNPVSLDSPVLISNNTWHYCVASYDNSTKEKKIYIDGIEVASENVTGTLVAASGTPSIGGENSSGEVNNRFSGDLDEIRAIPSVLSPDWIKTEFNNQNSPSDFYSISAEYPAEDLCITLPIKLIDFNAKLLDERKVEINWITSSEVNNSHFIVQKSKHNEWINLEKVKAAGNSSTQRINQIIDNNPFKGVSYYRLKQVYFDGKFSYSAVRTIDNSNENNGNLNIYPNPTNHSVTISGDAFELEQLNLISLTGKEITHLVKFTKLNSSKYILDISKLSKGQYLLKTKTKVYRIQKI
ncbi:DUF2341 domain-containing protein [Brumimicrobium aurantiacum]|uniref:DUF2341 domain-containing protein n=1 Tax=Brumimicrobium aurantiacum TaxID=1737063 RepID=A0A3E1F0N3_9FLAO|nr:DUF2341 domain-containing protein [Brumimicrobium aurantiacum]RFC55277.1 DUF2341 domain-containing protein [Brumimicrobium aurantiacum]